MPHIKRVADIGGEVSRQALSCSLSFYFEPMALAGEPENYEESPDSEHAANKR
jgi:hypothetical protein